MGLKKVFSFNHILIILIIILLKSHVRHKLCRISYAAGGSSNLRINKSITLNITLSITLRVMWAVGRIAENLARLENLGNSSKSSNH